MGDEDDLGPKLALLQYMQCLRLSSAIGHLERQNSRKVRGAVACELAADTEPEAVDGDTGMEALC